MICAFDSGAFDSVSFDTCVQVGGGTPFKYPKVRWEPSDTIFEQDEEDDSLEAERLRNLEKARRALAEKRVLDKIAQDQFLADRLVNLERAREIAQFNRGFRADENAALEATTRRETQRIEHREPPPPTTQEYVSAEDRRQTEIKEERMRNLAKAQEANRLKKEREEEIYQQRLKSLAKARKAKK